VRGLACCLDSKQKNCLLLFFSKNKSKKKQKKITTPNKMDSTNTSDPHRVFPPPPYRALPFHPFNTIPLALCAQCTPPPLSSLSSLDILCELPFSEQRFSDLEIGDALGKKKKIGKENVLTFSHPLTKPRPNHFFFPFKD